VGDIFIPKEHTQTLKHSELTHSALLFLHKAGLLSPFLGFSAAGDLSLVETHPSRCDRVWLQVSVGLPREMARASLHSRSRMGPAWQMHRLAEINTLKN